MTTAELRVLETRMDMLNTLLLDLIDQLRDRQMSRAADQGPRPAKDLSRTARRAGLSPGGYELAR